MMITIKKNGSVACLKIEGRLDTVTSIQFDQEMQPIVEKEQFLIFDFSDCPYLSSSGIRSLLSLTKKQNSKNGRMVLYSLPPAIVQVLEMAGLQRVFTIAATENQALAEIEKHLQASVHSNAISIGESRYRIRVSDQKPKSGRYWIDQGMVGYNELGISFGLGQYDDNPDHHGAFVTMINSSAFIPDSGEFPADFRLTHHPAQSGILADEAISFEKTPSCMITAEKHESILFQEVIKHIRLLSETVFDSPLLVSFIMANQDPKDPGLIVGLLTHQLGTIANDHSLTAMSCHPFFNSTNGFACMAYQLNHLITAEPNHELDRYLSENLSFDQILDVSQVNELTFVTNPVIWLFTASRIEDAALKRIKISGPEGFSNLPEKTFLTRRLYTDSSSLELKALQGGFSAQTFQVESYDVEGRKLRPTVLKIADKAMITREAERCQKYALPFILNNSAMVLGTEFHGNMGALRYNFVGIGGEETKLKWLTHLYESWPIEELEPLFDKIFLQILKPWYGQSVKGSIYPFRDHDPSLTFFPYIFDKVGEVLNLSCDEPQFVLEETGQTLLNPYWYLKHKYPQLRNQAIEYYTSICHGDLNMQNILLDQTMNVYLIDFSETIPRSAISDFARLEAIFISENLPVETPDEMSEAIRLVTNWYKILSLDELPEFDYKGPQKDKVDRNLALSRKMRSYAKTCTHGNRDILPYYFALLEWVLPIVCFRATLNQKRLSMVISSIVLQNIADHLQATS